MTDETTNTNQPATESEAQPAAKSGSLIKYILFGVGGLVAVVAIITATLMFVGVNKSADQPDASTTGTDKTEISKDGSGKQAAGDKSSSISEDSLLASLEDDPSAIEEIMKSLEFLDYKPDEGELNPDGQAGLSKEDSLQKVSWIESETNRLTGWETKLKNKERELIKLDREVSQKVLKLEQAESSRIAGLAKLYDGMDPRSVAALMANLDDETVVSILPRMKQKNASQVLALISAKRAARLSKQMITIAAN